MVNDMTTLQSPADPLSLGPVDHHRVVLEGNIEKTGGTIWYSQWNGGPPDPGDRYLPRYGHCSTLEGRSWPMSSLTIWRILVQHTSRVSGIHLQGSAALTTVKFIIINAEYAWRGPIWYTLFIYNISDWSVFNTYFFHIIYLSMDLIIIPDMLGSTCESKSSPNDWQDTGYLFRY